MIHELHPIRSSYLLLFILGSTYLSSIPAADIKPLLIIMDIDTQEELVKNKEGLSFGLLLLKDLKSHTGFLQILKSSKIIPSDKFYEYVDGKLPITLYRKEKGFFASYKKLEDDKSIPLGKSRNGKAYKCFIQKPYFVIIHAHGNIQVLAKEEDDQSPYTYQTLRQEIRSYGTKKLNHTNDEEFEEYWNSLHYHCNDLYPIQMGEELFEDQNLHRSRFIHLYTYDDAQMNLQINARAQNFDFQFKTPLKDDYPALRMKYVIESIEESALSRQQKGNSLHIYVQDQKGNLVLKNSKLIKIGKNATLANCQAVLVTKEKNVLLGYYGEISKQQVGIIKNFFTHVSNQARINAEKSEIHKYELVASSSEDLTKRFPIDYWKEKLQSSEESMPYQLNFFWRKRLNIGEDKVEKAPYEQYTFKVWNDESYQEHVLWLPKFKDDADKKELQKTFLGNDSMQDGFQFYKSDGITPILFKDIVKNSGTYYYKPAPFILWEEKKIPIDPLNPQNFFNEINSKPEKVYLFYEAINMPLSLSNHNNLKAIIQKGYTLQARPKNYRCKAIFKQKDAIKSEHETILDIKGNTQELANAFLSKSGYSTSNIEPIQIRYRKKNKEGKDQYASFLPSTALPIYQLLPGQDPSEIIFHIKPPDWNKRIVVVLIMASFPTSSFAFKRFIRQNEPKNQVSRAPSTSDDDEPAEKTSEKKPKKRRRRH